MKPLQLYCFMVQFTPQNRKNIYVGISLVFGPHVSLSMKHIKTIYIQHIIVILNLLINASS